MDEDVQRGLVDEIALNQATSSHAQAIRMRQFSEKGTLTTEVIQTIMGEEKPNQKERIVLRGEMVRKYIPKSVPINQTEDYVCKALEFYGRHLQKRKDRDSR